MVAHKTESNQRKNYKFWLHNSNEKKYLDIVDSNNAFLKSSKKTSFFKKKVYYKCADLVIFLLDLSSEEKLNSMKQNFFHIRNKLPQKNLKLLLIGQEKGFCNEKNYRNANDFAEKHNFIGFLLYKAENTLVKETVNNF